MSLHAVVDLETLDVVPRAAIASIGVAIVKDGGIIESAHWTCDWRNQDRQISDSTLKWWEARPPELWARELEGDAPLPLALGMLVGSIAKHGVVDGVWGFGAAFDNAILHDAADQLRLPRLWPYKRDMCLRTLAALAPDVTVEHAGAEHSAEDDAVTEARLLIALYKKLGLEL